MAGRIWTELELAFARSHYRRAKVDTIASCLGRTVKGVSMAAQQ